MKLLLTCEHASCAVPRRYAQAVPGARWVASHRGWDRGALRIARHIERTLQAPLFVGSVTRLLIDLNRSLHHRGLFGPRSGLLSEVEKREVLDVFYLPFRERVQTRVAALLAHGPVLHVSVHTFTPVLSGVKRSADVGLLFDPSSDLERDVVADVLQGMKSALPGMALRRNYPYRGTADGHTTALRRHFGGRDYAGIELEFNQRLIGTAQERRVSHASCDALAVTLRRRDARAPPRRAGRGP